MTDPTQTDAGRRTLVTDSVRRDVVDQRHEMVSRMLNSAGAGALLLQDPANIAWITAGADFYRLQDGECRNSVFVTPEARVFATNAVDSVQIFEREAYGLGFQLKQREWFQPHQELIADLCRGRKVVSDSPIPETKPAESLLQPLRLTLSDLDIDRLRRLGAVAVHAVESAARNLRPGKTEAEVAGEVAHRLVKRTVTPVRISVAADGRGRRYRHWTSSEDRIQSWATIGCVCRRWGLHVQVARTVCLDRETAAELKPSFEKAVLVHATGQFFSRPGEPLGEVWKRVRRIYEKFGLEAEWQLSDQADISGYRPGEIRLLPGSDFEIPAAAVLRWHPAVGPIMPADTIVVTRGSMARVTASSTWPELTVRVKGREVRCPGMLVRSEEPAAELDQQNTQQATDEAAEAAVALADTGQPEPAGVDTIWELDLSSDASVFDEEDSPWSEESVLD